MEKRNRIRVSLFAYAYEIMNDSLISDSEFDALCLKINPSIETDNPIMDRFFREDFSPHTGMWIYKHPELDSICSLYQRITGKIGRVIPAYKNNEMPVTAKTANMGFKTSTEMKIYLASLGFKVVPHSLVDDRLGRLDFEFDRDFFHIKQHCTNTSKSISYNDWFKYPLK